MYTSSVCAVPYFQKYPLPLLQKQTHALEGLRKTAQPLNKLKLHVFIEPQLMTKLNNGLKRYKRWSKEKGKNREDTNKQWRG
jgi:hypothetical protein